jgi:glycine/D-amino acid oxidase-like deaminating enzyme
MNRRDFLSSLAALTLTGCVRRRTAGVPLRLAPIRADINRIFRITVCLRPFRAAGPRLDVEPLGRKTVIHNYGHGGSGWSLSWGSSSIATEKALSTGEREFAVIGCGALGLTSATLLQRAGAKVTIYAKERPPDVRSSRATGAFTPDSRIALSNSVSPDFPDLWEKMARKSLQMYASYLGLPGNPVEWTDRYNLSDTPPESGAAHEDAGGLEFAHYGSRIADVAPRSQELSPGTHPFPTRFARRNSGLTFNIAAYSKQLVNDFLIGGGKIEQQEFHSPSDLAPLPQKVVVNATGYGARALWNDESIIPVRGQIAWLIPQPEVNYGIIYKDIVILGRRDGIVVQAHALNEADGYNDANEEPDRHEAEAAIAVVAELYDRMSPGNTIG